MNGVPGAIYIVNECMCCFVQSLTSFWKAWHPLLLGCPSVVTSHDLPRVPRCPDSSKSQGWRNVLLHRMLHACMSSGLLLAAARNKHHSGLEMRTRNPAAAWSDALPPHVLHARTVNVKLFAQHGGGGQVPNLAIRYFRTGNLTSGRELTPFKTEPL